MWYDGFHKSHLLGIGFSHVSIDLVTSNDMRHLAAMPTTLGKLQLSVPRQCSHSFKVVTMHSMEASESELHWLIALMFICYGFLWCDLYKIEFDM